MEGVQMQRWLWLILISGWGLAGCFAALAADNRRWQLVADVIPPYQNDQAADQGVLSQLVLSALQQQQVAAEVVLESWPSVKKHAAEPHHASFFWLRDLELEKNWFFSEPLFKLTTYLVVRADMTHQFSRLDELRPYRLAITEWASYGDTFDRLKPELKLRLQVSDHQSMQALLRGEVDIALMDPVIAHLLLSQLDDAARQKVRLQPLTSLTAQDVYLVCSRNYLPCFEFMQKFNKGWQHLRATGVLEQSLGPVVHYPE
jgi:polar amino acid transport system substrate-binding protein